ncbi:FAD-dependent oxidoreductase [Streptomyces mirabilis]|uniref:FAD-dependent oxidoreductase n=1 Tax=Streptomyces mirabilis TaxID=68239 RepID=UPI0036A58BC9
MTHGHGPQQPCQGPDDPRLYDVGEDFREVLAELATSLGRASTFLRRRALHHPSATAAGTVRVEPAPQIPAHAFFRPGRRFAVLARYSNALPADDIAPSLRGVTLRFFEEPTAAGAPFDGTGAGNPLLDLTLNTGECFHAATAEMFLRLDREGPERDEALRAEPHLRTIMWDNHRHAIGYPDYDYHSQVPRHFIAQDGTGWFVRYRLVPVGGPRDAGRVDPGDRWLPPAPPAELPRPESDTRPATFLRDDLRQRLQGSPVRAVLQLQLRPQTGLPDADSAALNSTRNWAPQQYPWHDLASLTLDTWVDDATAEPLRFNPALAPPDLGIALARSCHDTASVNHLRALVYQFTAAARLGERPPQQLQALVRPNRAPQHPPTAQRTVCVLGAGPSGLTAARELERAGHRVTVLETAPEIAGKCESVQVDGRVYDLGGHLCTTAYQRVAELAQELGAATEDTTPHRVYDLHSGASEPQSADFFRPDVFRRYAALRADAFPDIGRPGLAHSARALAAPVAQWLAEHELEPLAQSLGTGYSAAGYGFLDSDLPALYFVKYVEMTGLLSTTPHLLGHTGSFTPADGFAGLWRKVADGLQDLRTGVRVDAVERHANGVRIRTDSGTLEADALIVTVPLDRVGHLLDTSDTEWELASQIRHLDYYTYLCTVRGLPHDGFYLVDQHTRTQLPGRCVAFHHRYPDTDVYAFYSYGGPGLSPQDVEDRLGEDIARMGGELVAVHQRRRWPFMPHFPTQAIMDGAFDRLEALQGQRNTYHLGSLPSYELVESNVSYAQDTVRRHFPPVGSLPPDSPDHTGTAIPAPQADSHTATGVEVGELRAWLADHVAAELGIAPEEIDTAAPLETYGLESISIAVIQGELSEWLEYRVPHTLLFELPTLDAVAEHLAAASTPPPPAPPEPGTATPPTRRSALLVPLTPARPFFLLGGIVGTTNYLRPLAHDLHALGHLQPVLGLEPPGVDGEEEPLRSIPAIAARYCEEIRRNQPYGPYTLGGHSFGGLLAYETARQLAAEGAEVAQVVLIDSYVPDADQSAPFPDEAAAIGELFTMNQLMSGNTGGPAIDPALPLAEQRAQLARSLGATGVLAEGHIETMLRVYQANLEAVVAYPLEGSELPVTLIRATDGFPPVMAPGRAITNIGGEDNGWHRIKTGPFCCQDVPGDHFSILADTHRGGVTHAVRDALQPRRALLNR